MGNLNFRFADAQYRKLSSEVQQRSGCLNGREGRDRIVKRRALPECAFLELRAGAAADDAFGSHRKTPRLGIFEGDLEFGRVWSFSSGSESPGHDQGTHRGIEAESGIRGALKRVGEIAMKQCAQLEFRAGSSRINPRKFCSIVPSRKAPFSNLDCGERDIRRPHSGRPILGFNRDSDLRAHSKLNSLDSNGRAVRTGLRDEQTKPQKCSEIPHVFTRMGALPRDVNNDNGYQDPASNSTKSRPIRWASPGQRAER